MNDLLRRKAVIRKATYFGVLLALFTLSMFWRGVFRLPVGDPTRIAVRDDRGQPVPLSATDRLARLPVKYQAEDLELRELDLGDAEVAGSLAQVSLVGFRGLVVTALWNATTNAQKRGEYDEMEKYASMLTRLQPHFITPWVYQAWNISYNVSVETDKLSDQYYYIAKGISILAEGDRVNTREYRRGDKVYLIGSPDIRYQLGFATQNKFTVADKVETLLCLSQLSLIPPDERDPDKFRVKGADGKPTGRIDPDKFREFCERYPQLARRLKRATKNPLTGQVEGLDLKTPERVVEFLETNWRIPARFNVDTKLPHPDDKAFPVFPRTTDEADPKLAGHLAELRRMETTPTPSGRDALDIRRVARVWFEHAQAVVPPPREGEPSSSPAPNEYDQFRYRIPERPSLIVFRMAPPRAQNYIAERLQKEGWFDATVEWNPDEGRDRDAKWFPPARPGEAARAVVLKAGTSARAEWALSYDLWEEFGRKNGLRDEDLARQKNLAEAADRALLPQLILRVGREPTDDELASLGLDRRHVRARRSVQVFDQNQMVTNYPKFIGESNAEKDDKLAEARRLFWRADELHARADEQAELDVRVRASAVWRRVLLGGSHAAYYTSEKGAGLNEITLDQEQTIARLLTKDPAVVKRVKAQRDAYSALVPQTGPVVDPILTRLASEDEAQARIALAIAQDEPDDKNKLFGRAKERVKKYHETYPDDKNGPTVEATARGMLSPPPDALPEDRFEWMKLMPDKNKPLVQWVQSQMREMRLMKDGLLAPPPGMMDGPPGPPGQARPGGPQNTPGAQRDQ